MNKKLAIFFTTILLTSTIISNSANAEVMVSTTNRYGNNFDTSWEKAVCVYSYDYAYIGDVTYGYNTFLINEDYTWTTSAQYFHKAMVQNPNGVFYGDEKDSMHTSKIEVTHRGTTPAYGIILTNLNDSNSNYHLE